MPGLPLYFSLRLYFMYPMIPCSKALQSTS